MLRSDPALFYFVHENHVCGFIALHVDDIIWVRNSNFDEAVLNKLRTKFLIGRENNIPFRYLGLDMSSTNPNEVTLSQYHYVRDLNVENDLSCHEEKVRSAVGKLLWVSSQTRPDVSFHVSNLASSIKNATEKIFRYALKIVKQLQNNNVIILEKNENLRIAVYVDASLANLSNGGSQEGYLIFLVGENRKCSLLNWQSKRIKEFCSSLSAETLTLCDALDHAIFLQQMISRVTF